MRKRNFSSARKTFFKRKLKKQKEKSVLFLLAYIYLAERVDYSGIFPKKIEKNNLA
jgi:hypothetical protein